MSDLSLLTINRKIDIQNAQIDQLKDMLEDTDCPFQTNHLTQLIRLKKQRVVSLERNKQLLNH